MSKPWPQSRTRPVGAGWWLPVGMMVAATVLGGCPRPPVLRPDAAPPAAESLRPAYRETMRLAVGLPDPRGLARGADGRLYVAYARRVETLAPTGETLGSFPVSGEVYGLAVGDGDRLYVGLRDHVEVYTNGGQSVATWEPLGERARLTAVAAHGDWVWAADAGDRVVLRYDRTGRLLGKLGEKDEARGVPGLIVPSPYLDVAPAADGTLWVANPGRAQVENYTAEGRLNLSWGQSSPSTEGFMGCCNPVALAVLPDGSLVTAEKGVPRVKIYTPQGQLAALVAGPESFGRRGEGLRVVGGGKGEIYVLDPAAGAVRVFEPIKEGP